MALRGAIRRVYTDDALRSRVAENGYRLATALGGEEHLYGSIVAWLQHDWQRSPQVGR